MVETPMPNAVRRQTARRARSTRCVARRPVGVACGRRCRLPDRGVRKTSDLHFQFRTFCRRQLLRALLLAQADGLGSIGLLSYFCGSRRLAVGHLMQALEPDITAYVRKRFVPGEQADAIDVLANARQYGGKPADARMLRCALVTSKDTLAGLRFQIDGLAYDYRAVILEAEYRRQHGEWVQTRDLSKPLSVDA